MRTRRFSATPGARQAYLDCELCGGDPDGINTFSMIQLASDAGNAAGLVIYVRSSLSRRRGSLPTAAL